MFTAFMDDAANILSFYGNLDVDNNVGYAVELWMFKPRKSGRQVNNSKNDKRSHFILIVWIIGDESGEYLYGN